MKLQNLTAKTPSTPRKTLTELPWRSWRLGGSLAVVAVSAMLAGCGEYKQKVEYADGGYQGKQDTRMWDNEKFMHDRSVWKQMVNERTQRQNEYVRVQEQE